jgi:hypothetical protein
VNPDSNTGHPEIPLRATPGIGDKNAQQRIREWLVDVQKESDE